MRTLDRYVVKTVAGATVLVLMVVLALDLIFGFIGELDEVRNDYQMLQAVMYVLFTLPRRIYDYLPLAAFMGSLIGLGMLANTSELVVMRAAGISVRRIVWAAMKPALVVVVVGALLGEYGAPYFERIAQSEKAVAQGSGKGMESSGLWHREGNTYMHFNAIEPNGVLHGVSLFEYDDQQRLQTSLFAQRALYQRDQWLLEDLVITRMADTQVTKEQQASRVWETELSPKVLNVLIIKPDNLSMSGLFTYGRYLGEQGLNAAVYWMAFWKKALQPLATAVLVLVAISFVFGPLRSVTMGFRVFTGIVVGLLFKYMQDLLGPLSMVFGFDPVVATLAPILICAAAGTVLLRRAG